LQAYELKQQLSEDVDKIIKLLEDLDMHHIKYREGGNKIICGMPDGDNPSSTSIYIDSLKVRAYTRDMSSTSTNGEHSSYDIYSLYMYIKGFTFPETIRHIHKLLEITYTYYDQVEEPAKKLDMLKRFRSIKTKRDFKYDLETHPELLLCKYDPLPHVDFLKDNILPRSYKKYDTRFDDYSKRIVLTHRKWDTGEILGFFGRTTIPNYKDLGINKYVGIMPFDRGGNLFGLNINYDAIQKEGYVVVLESEKSLMQADTFGVNATCAMCCADLTREQRKILISLDVPIIFGFDKGISKKHIEKTCKPFYGVRQVYYMWDRDDMLKDKDSPTDNGILMWEMLMMEKVKYVR